jgi:hypothetical protein
MLPGKECRTTWPQSLRSMRSGRGFESHLGLYTVPTVDPLFPSPTEWLIRTGIIKGFEMGRKSRSM